MTALKKKRTYQVLLVEDNPGDVRLTKEAFIEGNLPVELNVVTDGLEATKFINRIPPYSDVLRPDIILLDLNLPKKNGTEVLKEIKKNEEFRKIPVIVLTTSVAPSDIQICYDNYANCYINKPVDFDSFFEVVKVIEEFWLKTAMLPS